MIRINTLKMKSALKVCVQLVRKRGAKTVIPISLLTCSVVIVLLLKATKPVVQSSPPSEKSWPVYVTPATPRDIAPTRKYFGTIVPVGEIDIRAEVKGRVVEANRSFVNGGKVKKGTLLLSIDPFTFNTRLGEREAELAEAIERLAELRIDKSSSVKLLSENKEQLQIRKRELTRREKLFRRNTIPEKRLDEAKLILNETRQKIITGSRDIKKFGSNIQKQKATIKRRKIALEVARRDLQDAMISAPFDGFLTDVTAAEGRFVTEGEKLAKLIKAETLEVKFQIGTSRFSRVLDGQRLTGQSIKIRWKGEEGKTYRGAISRIESVIDATAGGISLFAQIDDLDINSKLRPGAFVEVFLTEKTLRSVIKIPETALHGGFVYIIEDNRLKEHPVKVEARLDDTVIVSGAFSSDDQIVTNSFNGIGPGIMVNIRK